MLNRIARLWSDPYRVIYAARAKADRDGLYRQYRQLAERQGLDALYFVLSFDCDTREDADSVLRVHERLRDMGVSPVYAVPGEILTKGEQVYRAIAESGGEFINHGYRDHTFFDTQKGRYASCFFYDEQPLETVRADIVNGDRHLREMLGVVERTLAWLPMSKLSQLMIERWLSWCTVRSAPCRLSWTLPATTCAPLGNVPVSVA